DADADRRSGAHRPEPDAAVLEEGELGPAARLDHRLRPVREAPERRGRVVDRAHRTGSGRARGMADRGRRARRALHRDRRKAAARMSWKRRAVAAFAAYRWWKSRPPERITPESPPDRRAETIVIWLLFAAAASSIGFVAVYAVGDVPHRTQFLGLSLGLAFALLSAALILVGKRLVAQEQLEEEYPKPREHEQEEQDVVQLVEEGGDRFTRKRLLVISAGAAGTALGAALIAPAASLGPFLDVDPFFATPWARGRRLVDEAGKPMRAADIERDTFYT